MYGLPTGKCHDVSWPQLLHSGTVLQSDTPVHKLTANQRMIVNYKAYRLVKTYAQGAWAQVLQGSNERGGKGKGKVLKTPQCGRIWQALSRLFTRRRPY